MTIITKRSILDVVAVLDPPLLIYFWEITGFNPKSEDTKKMQHLPLLVLLHYFSLLFVIIVTV